jgi:NADPH2:quinone reductase
MCTAYGPPEAMTVVETDDPAPRPGCVIVDVAYAAVNFPDVLMVQNLYQVSIPPPFIPGNEYSGIVREVGEGVEGLAPGDAVFGATMIGAYAERVSVPAAVLRRVPDGVDLASAAAFWVAHATAYHGLRSIADVRPGEKVLVLGAAGGVGLAAVEIARHLGAEVIAAASTKEKLALCADKGATHLIDVTENDLREMLRGIAPDGIDTVIDPVGGPLAEKALRALRWKGRFVTVGYASGEIPRIPLNLVLLKGCIVRGFELRTFGFVEPDLARRDEAEMMEALAVGALRPHISAIHPLDDVAGAMNALADRRSIGKVLLEMPSSSSRR